MMAGRTMKVKASNIRDQMWLIMFEIDQARRWLGQLEKRAKKNAAAAASNRCCPSEQAAEMRRMALSCFEAQDELADVAKWVADAERGIDI
jgi:hypothetical protein